MSNFTPTTSNSRSWRDIPQQVKPRAMSAGGRRRVLLAGLKGAAAAAVLGAIAWGVIEVVAALDERPKHAGEAPGLVPVRDVVLTTDGVLDQAWAVRTLALPKHATLMDLDLFKLRSRLLASGQVHTATITRSFPSTLTLSITERPPIARVLAQAGAEAPREFFVARDGVVFDGTGFDPQMVSTLPWLDGVKLVRQGAGFAPIADMGIVADLLGKAKLEAEHLYRTWRVVSLARFESDGEIEVRSTDVPRIIFGRNEDFFRQLARLDALIDVARKQTDRPLNEVNLALGPQVPVVFDGFTPGSAGQVATEPPALARTVFPVLPNLHSKPKREF